MVFVIDTKRWLRLAENIRRFADGKLPDDLLPALAGELRIAERVIRNLREGEGPRAA